MYFNKINSPLALMTQPRENKKDIVTSSLVDFVKQGVFCYRSPKSGIGGGGGGSYAVAPGSQEIRRRSPRMSTISAHDVNRVNLNQGYDNQARTAAANARNATPDSVRMSPFVRGISHPPDYPRQASEDPSQSNSLIQRFSSFLLFIILQILTNGTFSALVFTGLLSHARLFNL